MTIGDEWVSQRLLGRQTQTGELEGEEASYETANPGTSFDFSSLANGLKEEIEIADPSQPSTFHFELDASAGLTPEKADDGSIEFRNEEDELVATLPPPVMTDSSEGMPTISDDVHYSLSPQEGGSWKLTVEADRQWLEHPDRAWPVIIDPTLTVPAPTMDCNMFSGAYETWSGFCGFAGWKTDSAFAWYDTKESGRSILYYNIKSSIPTTAYVTSATLGLHAPGAVENTTGLQVRRVTDDWGENVSWRCQWTSAGTCVTWNPAGGEFTERRRRNPHQRTRKPGGVVELRFENACPGLGIRSHEKQRRDRQTRRRATKSVRRQPLPPANGNL